MNEGYDKEDTYARDTVKKELMGWMADQKWGWGKGHWPGKDVSKVLKQGT